MTRGGLRPAAVAAALVAGFVAMVFWLRPLPLPVLRLLGVHGGLDLAGGITLIYAPAPDVEQAVIERRLMDWADRSSPGARVTPEADGDGSFALEFPGVAERDLAAVVELLTLPGLQFRVVDNDSAFMQGLYARTSADPRAVELGVTAEVDMWTPDEGGQQQDYYLAAETREALTTYLAEAVVGAPPVDREILFEHLYNAGEDGSEERWRSYYVERAVALDGSSIASSTKTTDPYTGQPIVLVDFTRDGAEAFGELTARMIGRKLATVVGGVIKSAPIINGAIHGGRCSITMGGSDAEAQERDAAALVAVLRGGPLPPGGRVRDATYVAPSVSSATLWLARVLLGVIPAAIAFGLILVLARRTEPAPRSAGPATRPPPWRALAVTLSAPVALYLSTAVTLPGVNEVALDMMPDALRRQLNPFVLGLAPLIIAFVAVELATALVPGWQRARVTPDGRRKLGRIVIVLGMAVAAVHGHATATYLLDTGFFESTPIVSSGSGTTAILVLTLMVGTLLLGVFAGVLTTYGLGNGYSVLIGAGVVIHTGHFLMDDPTPYDMALSAPHAAVAVVLIAAVAIAIGWLLTRRVPDRQPGDPRAAPIAPPVAGLIPLTWTFGVGAVVSLITAVGLQAPPQLFELMIASSTTRDVVDGVLVVGLTFGLGWLLVRPRAHATLLARMTGVAIRPPVHAWLVAAALSAIVLLALYLAALAIRDRVPQGAVFDVVAIATLTAIVLDIVADWRARRRADLVPVWPIQQAGLAAAAVDVLARAGITAHLRGAHHRALLHVVGPYVPIEVMVPADRAGEATAILRDMFDPAARGSVSAF
jgi:preprotein translocase subunit SecY